jgi:predicted 2-oxoglutarate/Fe(II)-dependent dioxygenase YbiX
MSFRLSVGDRAPNFTLPDGSGAARMFYAQSRGQSALLAFLGPMDDPTTLVVIDALERWSEAYGRTLQLLLVIFDTTTRCNGAARSLLEESHVLADVTGKIGSAYREAAGLAPGDAHFLLILDANQRVLGIFSMKDAAAVAPVLLEAFRALDTHLMAKPLLSSHESVAPVLMIPNILDRAMCDRLMSAWHTCGRVEGAMVTQRFDERDTVDHRYKKRLDHIVTSPSLHRELSETLGPRLGSETLKAFHLTQFVMEPFVVACYDARRGDFVRPHRDNLNPRLANRRYAVTINLNEDYDGGELRFAEYGPERYRPRAGGAIVFSCSLLHEALQVRQGRRFILLTFLLDPSQQVYV